MIGTSHHRAVGSQNHPSICSPDQRITGSSDYMAHFTASDVSRILPHRYPFLLVDKVTEFIPGQRIVGIKHFSSDDQVARGNAPGIAIIPTGIILELVTQLGAVLVMERPEMA